MEIPEIHAKTRIQIAIEYCISVKTLYRWLKSEGIYLNSGLIKPNELRLIYSTFGAPKNSRSNSNNRNGS